jgi:signal transduction histidine kinase
VEGHGHGLQSLASRTEAMRGRLAIDSRTRAGTRVLLEVPAGKKPWPLRRRPR